MRPLTWKTCLVGGLALAVSGGPALAMSGLALSLGGVDSAPSLALPVVDQENLAVEEDLVPDEVPAKEEDAGAPKQAMPEPKTMGGDDIEDETIKRLEPGGE